MTTANKIRDARESANLTQKQLADMLVDGEEAVVKRYFCDTACAVGRLESYNPEYSPRVFRGAEIERLKILGVAKRVITDL